MAPGGQIDPIYPDPSRRNGYLYFFYGKHHGGGGADDARWSLDLSQPEEFMVFDTADFHNISDDRGWLYGILRSADGSLRDLGTRQQQVAEFPRADEGIPWHGYPSWPLGQAAPPRRRGEKFRPSKEVFESMQAAGLITERERKRLYKGRHV